MVMQLLETFFLTFFVVFIGELGDKSQIAAGTSSLLYKSQRRVVFLSSSLALLVVTIVTTLAALVIPASVVSHVITIGGMLLILYSIYLIIQIYQEYDEGVGEKVEKKPPSTQRLFLAQFLIVFTAEFGDKTQIATLAAAVKNKDELSAVFFGSLTALITITGLTVWGVSFLPQSWIRKVQVLGAFSLFAYGLYMVFW